MKKRASFILVLPALAMSCARVETNDTLTAVQTDNPPASLATPEPASTPTSVGAIVQPTTTASSLPTSPPPKKNPHPIHKNPPGFISGKKPDPL